MKKKNNQKTEKILIYSAIALLIIAIIGGVYLILDLSGVVNPGEKEGTEKSSSVTTNADTTAYVPQIDHEPIETRLNDDGTIHQVVYYKDNVYDGCIDYVYLGASVKAFYRDKDNKAYQVITTTVDYNGNIILETITDGTNKLMETSFVYYEDATTLWKKTVIEFEKDKEITTKLLHDENGNVIDKYVYENDTEISHTVYTYDENGEKISESEVTP